MKFVQVFVVILPAVLFVAQANSEPVTVGQSFFLPDQDIYIPQLGGFSIFKQFDGGCYKWEKLRVTRDGRSTFEDTDSFYKQISSDSSISITLAGMYTMGATLHVKTERMSQGDVDVKGTSLDISTYVNVSYLDPNCFKTSKGQLTDDVINMFDSLPLKISKPWLRQSWQHYETFLKTFGSHFVIKTYLGAVVRQWTFSKITSHYTDEQLKVRACVDFAGTTDVGKLNLSACSGVNKTEAESVIHLDMSNDLSLIGGTDKTRNQFRSSRSQKDLDQLLNEGRALQSPVRNEYTAIWDILMMKFYQNSTRYAKAMNLMSYYHGYNDFGCSYLYAGDWKLRAFYYSEDSTQELPSFKCVLINQGCHVDDDCSTNDAGTTSHCYGKSCYEYEHPHFGYKAKYVIARTKKSGHYYEGVNQSCEFVFFFSSTCRKNHFSPSVIWDGEDLVQLASYRSAQYANETAVAAAATSTTAKKTTTMEHTDL